MTWTRQNAVIEGTTLGWEDHGIFTFGLNLDYGDSGQTAGNLCLSYSPPDIDHELFSPGSLDLLAKIMQTVGVTRWEDLKGKHVVAMLDRPYGLCKGIGHFLGKGDDLIFQEYMEAAQLHASSDLERILRDRRDK